MWCLQKVKAFSTFSHYPVSEEVGGAQEGEGPQLILTGQKDISYLSIQMEGRDGGAEEGAWR